MLNTFNKLQYKYGYLYYSLSELQFQLALQKQRNQCNRFKITHREQKSKSNAISCWQWKLDNCDIILNCQFDDADACVAGVAIKKKNRR